MRAKGFESADLRRCTPDDDQRSCMASELTGHEIHRRASAFYRRGSALNAFHIRKP
jgi:hypothetical protein